MFTDDEALALVLGLLAARRLGLTAAAPATEGALAKVERVLPAGLRERVGALHDVLVLNLRSAEMPPATETVVALSMAARQRRRVRLSHRSSDRRESERTFDPYGVVYHAGMWYTAGHCHLRNGVRVFRLDRVLKVEPAGQDETFVRPSGVDSLDLVLRSLAATPRAYPVVVALATTPEEARLRLPASLAAALEATADGVVLRCTTDSPAWMARLLAGLECDFVVREPAELRQALRRLATRLLGAAADVGGRPEQAAPGAAAGAPG
jgi:predicted DNA-binding transcriptional regulator YafY